MHAGVPAPATLVQVPFADAPLAAEQVSQAPEQALPQQNPSAHAPVVHWLLAVHTLPCASFGTQVPPPQ